MRHRSNRCADHRANEQTWSKYSAGVPRSVRDRRGDDLEHSEDDDNLEDHVAVENSLHLIVSDAQHLRHEKAEDADSETARDGLNPE